MSTTLELPATVEPKLLRAIQEREIHRVGSNTTTRVNVRLLAATNRDLDAEVRAGRFREDLFHRLNVYPLLVPTLRERAEDIPSLAGHFCDAIQRRLGLGPVRPAAETLALLAFYAWPGNMRELENVIPQAILKAAAGVPRGRPLRLEPGHLSEDIGTPGPDASREPEPPASPKDKPLRSRVAVFERDRILKSLARNAGNWSAAARDLGLHRSNLHHLAKRLGLKTSHT